MRKPTYDPKGFVSRLQSLAKYSVLYAEHQNEAFETSIKNSTKRLVEAYQKQNEYIECLEKELEHLKQPFNLYHVMNGWKKFDGVVYAEVVAPNEERAKELACESFKETARYMKYNSDYWTNLEAELIEEDIQSLGGTVAGTEE